MTETEPRPPVRALVASFLFTDLVGFSKGTTAEQYAAKATLSAILRSNLAALRDADYRIKDTGDGALIAFTSNPEHALYMALAIAEDFGRAAAAAGFPSNSLRTGLHLGSVKESIDLEARPNFIGDGINAAKRIMDFAAPGQITASRSFFDAVASLDSAYAELFSHVGASDDKHGRSHELYAISPSSTVLEKLKLDLTPAAHEPEEFAAKRPATIKAKSESARPVSSDAQAESSHAVSAVRKWLLPGSAVIAIGIAAIVVGTKLNEPSAPRIPSVEPSAPAGPSTAGAPAQATIGSAPAPTISTPAVAPATSAERSSVDSQTSAAIPGKAETSAPVRAAPAVKSAPALDSSQPGNGAPPVAAAKTNATIKSRTDVTPSASVPANAASDRSSPRCSRIMEKATLGETLSTEEKRELASSCR